MLRHVLFLLFLYGMKSCSGNAGSSSDIEEQAIESKGVYQNGIKKNEVGANGLEANWEKVLTNFRNPVLEYLLHTNSDRTNSPSKKGVVREIRHSQVLLIPNSPRSSLPPFFINQLPQFESLKKPSEEGTRNPESSPVGSFWNFLKNKTETGDKTYKEGVVTSPVLHLNKDVEETKEETRIQTYPAVAVVINTFSKDGSLKKSVTHFQPDFNSIRFETNVGGAIHSARGSNANKIRNINNSQNTVKNFVKDGESGLPGENTPQGWPWPFANYLPIVQNDPFLTVNSGFPTSMYNAVSSMVEYGSEADACLKDHERDSGSDRVSVGLPGRKKQTTSVVPARYIDGRLEADIFGEVTMRSESLKRVNANEKPEEGDRNKRDTTSIFVKSREGGTVDISLEEPPDVNDILRNSQDERARSFAQVLVNTPPLSTILRPPQQESRRVLGYADKRKTKPSKPGKEEGSSEEVGEEQEEESTSQSQESANEAVAISPPPEGASVAEAKPIGLAIAGPGGVAASKPQGTAVAGPGGLAIARPVGTAIAGVDVEGSVPIGGQQKNKKKPKQEQEQTEAELHYVGGLTGPIGNPQPKEFADSIYYKTVKDMQGNNVQENLFFRGVSNANGFQLRMGQQNGNADQGYDHFPKYKTQF